MGAPQFRRRACPVTNDRLTKASMLAMLGPPPEFGETVSSHPSRAFFEKITQPWAITSFNSMTREVCVEITTLTGKRTTSVVLPELSASNPDSRRSI